MAVNREETACGPEWWTPSPRHPRPGEGGAYPGTGGGQGLPKGLKLHFLVMAHEVSQAAVAEGVPGDEVAPVLELGDDEMSAAVAPSATQTPVT